MSVRVLRSELFGQAKMKIEPRQPLHSRKMSKNSLIHDNNPHENGVDVDSHTPTHKNNKLVTVKKTQSIDQSTAIDDDLCDGVDKVHQATSMDDAEMSSDVVLCDLKNALNKVGNSRTVNGQEVLNLKDLLILNLDLIQHQQQLLITRDRQIKALTAEKDALKNRLERMDRRVSLLKHKGCEEVPNQPAGDSPTKVKTPSEKGGKRKSDAKSSRETPRKHLRLVAKSPTEMKEEVHHALRSSDPPPQELVAPPAAAVPTKRLRNNVVKDKIDLVRTPEDFFVPVMEFHDPEIVGKVLKSSTRKSRIKVEVPKWRFHPVSNYYQMEGTEITDDELYLKRHLKFENDEKRRKRWDMQRMREQTAYQKLVSSRATRSERLVEPKPVVRLHPDADGIRFIEVAETLPINVFGFPLPKLSSSDVQLNWPEKAGDQDESKESKQLRQKRR